MKRLLTIFALFMAFQAMLSTQSETLLNKTWERSKRLKTLFLFLMLAFTFSVLHAQTITTYFEDWVKSGGTSPTSSQNDLLERVATATDAGGNLLVASSSFNETSQVHDLLLEKYNGLGGLLWSQQFNISGGGDVLVGSLSVDAIGSPIFTGAVLNGTNSYDALTVKYTAGGTLEWSNTWNGAANGYDGCTAVTTDATGNIYVTGIATQNSISRDFLTIKYSTLGIQLWAKLYDQAGMVDAAAKISYSGGIVNVSGGVQVNASSWAMAAVRYNATSGAQMSAGIVSENIVFDEINGFSTDANGNTFIAGARNTISNGYDFLLLKLDPDLNLLWEATYDGFGGKDVAKATAVDANGNVYVTGYTTTPSNGRDYLTLKYNTSGILQWTAGYNGETAMDDEASDIAVDGNGDIFVTGFATLKNNEDFLIIWYDGDGIEKWTGRFNSIYDQSDKSSVIKIDDDGNLLVTGKTVTVDLDYIENFEVTTVKYSKSDIVSLPYSEEPSNSTFFRKNNGQLKDVAENEVPDVKYYTYGHTPSLYFWEDKLSFVTSKIDGESTTLDTLHRVDMLFIGEQRNTRVYPLYERSEYHNYYLGHIPQGRANVSLYSSILHTEAFGLVDLEYSSNRGGIIYSFIVKPGGDPSAIQLNFAGQEGQISVSGNGELVIGTIAGEIRIPQPEAFQLDEQGNEVSVAWSPAFQTDGEKAWLNTGSFDSEKPLIIRSTPDIGGENSEQDGLCWYTYYGGSSFDNLEKLAADASGNKYVIGRTYSDDLPGIGPLTTLAGDGDVYATKFSSVDNSLIWATFVGGQTDDTGFDLTSNGTDIFLTGMTTSDNYPVVSQGNEYEQGYVGASASAFISGLSGTTGVLFWSTYFGSNTSSRAYVIKIDGSDNLYIGGKGEQGGNEMNNFCDVPMNGGFPLCDPLPGIAYFQSYSSGEDGFFSMLNAQRQLVWSTFFGGEDFDAVKALAVSGDNLYIVGQTSSLNDTNDPSLCSPPSQTPGTAYNFPLCEPSGGTYYFQDVFAGGTGANRNFDAFIAKFDLNENFGKLLWSTYYGGNDEDGFIDVEVKSNGNIVTTGVTRTPLDTDNNCGVPTNFGFPSCDNGTSHFQPFASAASDLSDHFITEFSSQGQLIWATYIGGWNNETESEPGLADPRGGPRVTLDGNNNIYMVGSSFSTIDPNLPNIPIKFNPNTYNDPVKKGLWGEEDSYILGFSPSGELVWGTYLSGHNVDRGFDLMPIGDEIYVCGHGNSPDLNVFAAPPQYTQLQLAGSRDGYIACMNPPDFMVSTEEVGLEEKDGIKIFPNPAFNGQIHYSIENSYGFYKARVYNAVGQLLLEQSINTPSGSVSLGRIASGMYLVEFISNDYSVVRKVIVNQ